MNSEDVFPVGRSLPELLAAQALARGDATAVVTPAERISFGELAGHSADLARHLRDLGVGPEDTVGVFAEPSVASMTGVWGVLFAGAAYLPLSPEYPQARLRYMIEDAGVRVIVTQRRLRDRLAELAPADTIVVTREDVPTGTSAALPAPRPADLAYVIYTSGSTGKPKGVLIEHRAITAQMRWLHTAHGLDETRTVLQKTPLSFDAAQWEVLAPAYGATVVVADPGAYRDAERLVDLMAEHNVTTLQAVPTLLRALVDTEELGRCTALTQVFSGGESLSRQLAVDITTALPHATLVNLYGPTETTINSSSFTVDRDAVAHGPNTIAIGTPVDGTSYRILCPDGTPTVPGEIGELHIGGVQLARGYLNRPDLTAERFVTVDGTRLYRTGDLAFFDTDGTVRFVGRTDNQVKLRGFRVELDEITSAIETHTWVRNAAVLVHDDRRTGFQNLTAFIALNPREAALMDQGNHEAHHRSKQSRLQVRAQLAGAGVRDAAELAGKPVVDLPGRAGTAEQRRLAFLRKTYRFYEGGQVDKARILALLDRRAPAAHSRSPRSLDPAALGGILRHLGPFRSAERLLPKYAYASPGSLYATQLYLEIEDVAGLAPGYYYFHPADHRLVLIRPRAATGTAGIRLHLMGKRRAIEPVYRNNLEEVLRIEAGHIAGLLDEVLPRLGLGLGGPLDVPAVREHLECAAEDLYLGSFDVLPRAGAPAGDALDVYVQVHPGGVADLRPGLYLHRDGDLVGLGDDIVRRKDVIAINQEVYDRAGFGIALVDSGARDWASYVRLGRRLQRLQTNDLGLGFMSSGYSSETGNPLPAARRLDALLAAHGRPGGPSYFFVGGRVSAEQVRSEGMKEDSVHMRGPAEMVKDDLAAFLPHYMVPNRIVVLDELPLTANGKVDRTALTALAAESDDTAARPVVAPRTATEERVAALWRRMLKREVVSVHDDFFASGGNSLIAVGLVNRINRELGAALPAQVLFESPTVEKLAAAVDAGGTTASRLVPLHAEGTGHPVYFWPGLGGFTMNLRHVAASAGSGRPVFGVQAHGVNPGEVPYATITEMAAADVAMIKERQPAGPYTLWGYSFGARVAFETAYQLEKLGDRVDHLFLIAPGAPKIDVDGDRSRADEPSYDNTAFVTVLFSVFAGTITGPLLDECLRVARDDESFTAFVTARFRQLDADLVRRVVRIVRETYRFEYTFAELARRRVAAPVTIFRASGDDYSFIENASGYAAAPPTVVDLTADHYGLLREPGSDELVRAIRRGLTTPTKEHTVPHVNIKHFPKQLTDESRSELLTAVTAAVQRAFDVESGMVSISLEPVEPQRWNEDVYLPEIVERKDLLDKAPEY